MQDWGKEHNLSKDKGFTYFQSTSEADYANNLQQAAGSYNLIFGVGFALHNAVEEAAKDHSDLNYVLIDDVIKDQKNVASVTFADNEAAYLAGVAAAKTTKTKQVGFVGGIESEVISRFAAGFKAGVESVDPSIKVQVDYAGSFGDAAKGKQLQQHNTQLVQTLFTRQQVEQVLVSLQKQNHSMKAVLKVKKFGLSVLTATK